MKSPDAFKTISEVADELKLPQHVLRFWETRFKQINPLKRGGGRRYYRPDDVLLLKGIQHLLYNEGYTIKGVQRILKEHGNRFVVSVASGEPVLPAIAGRQSKKAIAVSKMAAQSAAQPPEGGPRAQLQAALSELLECKRLLDQVR